MTTPEPGIQRKLRGRPRDISGQRFGRLIALRPAGYDRWGALKWECLCDCGKTSIVVGKSLRCGNTASCGCLHREGLIKRLSGHGKKGTAEHNIWGNMKSRCRNPNDPKFGMYGGRGIRVCSRWRNSFLAFLEDMGERPSPTHSIDRFPDQNGDYEPGNCRWATPKEQARNTRRNRMVTLGSVTLSVVEWSERTGISYHTIQGRLNLGWSPEKTLTTTQDGRSLRWKK